jgi:hypothetical protein
MEVIVHLSSTHYQVIGIVEQARAKEIMLSHDTRHDMSLRTRHDLHWGNITGVKPWYGGANGDGAVLDNFHTCFCDWWSFFIADILTPDCN